MDDRRLRRIGPAAGFLGWLVAAVLAVVGARARRHGGVPIESPEPLPVLGTAPQQIPVPPPAPEEWRSAPPEGPSAWQLVLPPAPPTAAPRPAAPVRRPQPRPLRVPRPGALATSLVLLLVSIGAGLLLSAWIAGGSGSAAPSAGDGPRAADAPASFSARSVQARRNSRYTSTVARARTKSIRVYKRARSGKPRLRLKARRVGKKAIPIVFRVDGRRGDWLKVQLPVRPNGSTGWVRRRDVALAATDYRVKIDVRRFRLTVWRRGKVVAREKIGTGQAVTPTPRGRYFITDLIRPPKDDGLYGPYAFGLSAFSPVLSNFGGGPGQIGFHGTNEPDKLGTRVSKGCIRLRNKAIRRLAKMLPLGTPVEIAGKPKPVKAQTTPPPRRQQAPQQPQNPPPQQQQRPPAQ